MISTQKSIVAKNRQFHKDPVMTSKTNGKVNFPSLCKSKNNIHIGKQKSCEVAHDCIHSATKDTTEISEVEISIPCNLHKSLFGSKECLIGSVVEECGKIHIYFPRTKSGNPKAIIRGPIESVEKAKIRLLKLAEEEKAKNYSMAHPIKSQYHYSLISKNGGKLHKVFENSGTHIILPILTNKDQQLVPVIRTKAAGKEEQKEIEVLTKNLVNVVEDSVLINRKFHHFFVMHRAQLLQEMTEVYSGVTVTFSYEGKQNIKVTMKGEKACVQGAKKHIQRIFKPLDSHITIQHLIPLEFHPFFLGPMCSRVRQIGRDYKVQIKFPNSENTIVNPVFHKTGTEKLQNNSKEYISSFSRSSKTLYISGQKENCHAAVKALDSLVPVTTEVCVPYHLCPYIIGPKESGIRKLINDFEVYVQVTQFGGNSDIISIMGLSSAVENAKIRLQRQIMALQTKLDNQILRNFKLMFPIDRKCRSKNIGHKGLLSAQISKGHDITVHFPKNVSHKIQDQIIIAGHKENAPAAQDAIMRMGQKIKKIDSKEIQLNPHFYQNIIGFSGRDIHKIMSQFQVNIHVPPKGSCNTNITVIGLSDNVKDAIDHIHNLEKHYLPTNMKCEPQGENLTCTSHCSVTTAPPKGFVKNDVPCNSKTTAKSPDMENLKDNPNSKQWISPKTRPWRP